MNKLEKLIAYPSIVLGLSSISCLVEGEISRDHTDLNLTRLGAFVIGGALGYAIGKYSAKKNKNSSDVTYKK